MMKRLLSLLLTLAILLGAMPGLAETAVPVLHYADIASLKALAGDAQTGATWHEGMSPSASMNALQMWQWTDWFLSEKLRSLLGSAQDYIQLASGLPDSSLSTLEWELREREDQLTYYEEQLSDGRMAILNGIRLYQDVSASAYDRARAYDRMMEAKEEILKSRTDYEKEEKSRRADLQRQENRLQQKEENLAWADQHVVGVAQGVDEEIVQGLRENFNGECSEVGMYLAMARVAFREGYPEIGLYWEKAAYEEAEHAAKFAELLGEVVTDSTKKNLEMRVAAENGACAGKKALAAKAKQLNLDAIHDTVHEMAKDEARHGCAFAGFLKRYFND